MEAILIVHNKPIAWEACDLNRIVYVWIEVSRIVQSDEIGVNHMYREQILKSRLLKNVPIDVINQYDNKDPNQQDSPISVYERDGNYYVLDGLDTLLKMNGSGDKLIDCYVTHKNSFL